MACDTVQAGSFKESYGCQQDVFFKDKEGYRLEELWGVDIVVIPLVNLVPYLVNHVQNSREYRQNPAGVNNLNRYLYTI